MNEIKGNNSAGSVVHRTAIRRLERWFRVPIYPFLISIYAPLWLASTNYDLFPFSDAVRYLIASLAVAGIGILFLLIIFRNPHKAALLVSIGFLCLYSFSPLRHFLSVIGVDAPGQTATIAAAAIFLAIGIAVFFWKSNSANLTKILNGFAIALVLFPVAILARQELNSGIKRSYSYAPSIGSQTQSGTTPSIIHIVLDAYSRADALKSLYGFDNSHFIGSLRDMGFIVAENATTAYNQTILSMSSVFSMGYINEKLASISKNEKSEKEIRVALHWAFQTSPVLQRFRAMGYKIADVENFYWATQFERPDYFFSDAQATFGLSHFETTLIQFTPIYKLINEISALDHKYTTVKFALGPQQLDELERPFFFYNHILAPHAPFNMSPDGAFRESDSRLSRTEDSGAKTRENHEIYRDGYIAKLKYVNEQIIQKARSLIRDIPDPKIIIIHSDHGGALYYDQTSKARTCLRERFGALFAIYTSGHLPALEIGDRFNIVNTYRHVLSEVFDSNEPPLSSRHFFATWQNPERVIPVSDEELRDFGPSCRRQPPN